MDSAKLILNPARFRILQYIRFHGNARALELIENLKDIPRATIYHHLKILEEHKVIQVVEENRIRGTVEKTYSVREDFNAADGEGITALSTAFHLESMQEMNAYFENQNNDYRKDNVFFSSVMLNVTEQEYAELLQAIADLVNPYVDQEPMEGRELRKLSMISAPPKKDNTLILK